MCIYINSRAYICYHEAGHIESACLFGATVTGAEIDSSGKPHTSITHKEDLSTKMPVACGGYSVESLLFHAGNLLDQSGGVLTEQVFKNHAMKNAYLDKFPFYITEPFDSELGLYPGSPFQPRGGSWPQESDEPFIAYAEKNIIPALQSRLYVVTALAIALDTQGRLTKDEIESIRNNSANNYNA